MMLQPIKGWRSTAGQHSREMERMHKVLQSWVDNSADDDVARSLHEHPAKLRLRANSV
jgi:ferric-dicitrate binding protein FerR (iron transport regulator)